MRDFNSVAVWTFPNLSVRPGFESVPVSKRSWRHAGWVSSGSAEQSFEKCLWILFKGMSLYNFLSGFFELDRPRCSFVLFQRERCVLLCLCQSRDNLAGQTLDSVAGPPASFLCLGWAVYVDHLWKKQQKPCVGRRKGSERVWARVRSLASMMSLICTARGWAHRGGVLQIYSCANSFLSGLTFSELPPRTEQQALRYELFKGLWELLPNKIECQWKTKESTLYFVFTMLENGTTAVPKRISRW